MIQSFKFIFCLTLFIPLISLGNCLESYKELLDLNKGLAGIGGGYASITRNTFNDFDKRQNPLFFAYEGTVRAVYTLVLMPIHGTIAETSNIVGRKKYRRMVRLINQAEEIASGSSDHPRRLLKSLYRKLSEHIDPQIDIYEFSKIIVEKNQTGELCSYSSFVDTSREYPRNGISNLKARVKSGKMKLLKL